VCFKVTDVCVVQVSGLYSFCIHVNSFPCFSLSRCGGCTVFVSVICVFRPRPKGTRIVILRLLLLLAHDAGAPRHECSWGLEALVGSRRDRSLSEAPYDRTAP